MGFTIRGSSLVRRCSQSALGQHPHLVQYYDSGITDGRNGTKTVYILMELCTGARGAARAARVTRAPLTGPV